jgi:SlyX protein
VESRITELEIKISYTEDMLDELNRTIYRQQQQIDMLIENIQSLRQQMLATGNQPGEALSLRDEIPPHY